MKIMAFDKMETFFTGKLGLNVRNKPVKCCIWSIVLCGAGTWTLGKGDQK